MGFQEIIHSTGMRVLSSKVANKIRRFPTEAEQQASFDVWVSIFEGHKLTGLNLMVNKPGRYNIRIENGSLGVEYVASDS